MAEQVRRYDGTVAQLVGDEMLALLRRAGLPRGRLRARRPGRARDPARRAVRTRRRSKDAYGIELAVRIGINTGPVVVGMEARRRRRSLERARRHGQRRRAPAEHRPGGRHRGRPDDRAPGRGLLRGRGRLAGPPELEGHLETAPHLQDRGSRECEPVPSPRMPLVGRDFELSVLERDDGRPRRGPRRDRLDHGRAGHRQVAARLGGAQAATATASASSKAARVSYAQTFPYWPIRDLLREWLGVGASTPEARVRLELKAELARRSSARRPRTSIRSSPTCSASRWSPMRAQRIRELNRESIQTRDLRGLLRVHLQARRGAAARPRLRGPALGRRVDPRADRVAPGRHGGVVRGALPPLPHRARARRRGASASARGSATRTATARSRCGRCPPTRPASLATLAADGELPESVTEHLAERSGGNPFFLEEALRDLVERGALERENGKLGARRRRGRARDPGRSSRARCRRGSTGSSRRRARCSRSRPSSAGRSACRCSSGSCPRERARAGAHRAAAARPDRRGAPPPESRVPLPPRPRPGGRLREPRRDDAQEAAQARRRGPGGDLPRVPGGGLRAPRPPLQRGGRPRQGRRLPPEGRRRGARRSTPTRRRSSTTARRAPSSASSATSARARDTLFKMALTYHLAFDFENAEEMYDEAFSLPRRRGAAATSRPSTSRRRSRSPTPSSPATSTRRRA